MHLIETNKNAIYFICKIIPMWYLDVCIYYKPLEFQQSYCESIFLTISILIFVICFNNRICLNKRNHDKKGENGSIMGLSFKGEILSELSFVVHNRARKSQICSFYTWDGCSIVTSREKTCLSGQALNKCTVAQPTNNVYKVYETNKHIF